MGVSRQTSPQTTPFRHGVASGDPTPDRVVLWTRVTPTEAAQPGSGKGPRVTVRWQVARDARFTRVVDSGSVVTGPARDHTVKVDATGLRPGTTYYYRFSYDGQRSRVGRTRTAPAHDDGPAPRSHTARDRHLRPHAQGAAGAGVARAQPLEQGDRAGHAGR